jgi:hypothetical protein
MRFIAVIISLFLMLGYSHAQVSGSLSQGVAVNEVVIGAGAPTGAPAAGVKWYVDTTKNQATHFANGTVWQAVNASQDPEVIVGVASPTGTPPTGAKLYYNATLGRVTHVANAGAWAALPAWERKQAALTGGGVVTWVNKTLSFTQRFIAISFGRGVDNISTSGYYDINMPPVGTVIPGICGAPAQTVTAAGIPFSGGSQWHALYYKLPTGGSGSVASNFFFVGYVADCAIPENAILVAVENYDNNSLKLGTGEFIKPPTAPVFGASASAPLEGFYYPAAASYQGNGIKQ